MTIYLEAGGKSASDSDSNILLSQSTLNRIPKDAGHAILQSKWSVKSSENFGLLKTSQY